MDCLTKYYMATVQSHIDYCITIWGFSSNANCKLLQTLQNRAARIITDTFDWSGIVITIVKDLYSGSIYFISRFYPKLTHAV